jgi:hypothetical protein
MAVQSCVGIDLLEEQTILILMESPEQSAENEDKSIVTASLLEGSGFNLKCSASKGECDICIVAHCDAKIGWIPEWLINIAVRNLAHMILAKIQEASQILSSEVVYKKRISDKESPFYNHLRSRFTPDFMPQEIPFLSWEYLRETSNFSARFHY